MTGKILKAFAIAILLSANISHADIAKDLGDFWKDSGGVYNVNKPGSYSSQSGGYHTLGGASVRTPVRSVNLANIQLPGARAGCGGIDMFSGGFSHINSQQIEQTFKAVMNNAVGYAFQLAIETVSPKLAGTMSKIESIAREVNHMNINSCETAQNLVGGLWAKNSQKRKTICANIGNSQGIFKDWADGQQECNNGGKEDSTLKSGTGPLKASIIYNTNVGWQTVRKNAPFDTNQTLAQLAITLTGTVVIRTDGGNTYTRRYPPLGTSISDKNGLWQVFLNGSDGKKVLSMYDCSADTAKCLDPTTTQVAIPKASGYATKIRQAITSMQGQISGSKACQQTDASKLEYKCFSDEEHAILEQTPFPLYRLMNAYAIYGTSMGAQPSDYSDLVALSMVKS